MRLGFVVLGGTAVAAACGPTVLHNNGESAGGGGTSGGGDPVVSPPIGGRSIVGGPGGGGRPGTLPGDGGEPAVGGDGAGGTGGASHGGTGGTGGHSGAGGGTPLPQPCGSSPQCPIKAFCKAGVCTCPGDLPSLCGADGSDGAAGAGGAQDLGALVCVSKDSDPVHCGVCGTACAPGAACDGGDCGLAPEGLVSVASCGSIRQAIRGANLFWTERDSGQVRTVPLAGETVAEVAGAQLKPTQLAVDADGVYWLDEGNGAAGSSRIMKKPLPLAAGAPIVLKADAGGAPILALALGTHKLYYGLDHDVHAISTDESVASDVIVGTAASWDVDPPLPSGEPAGLVVDEPFVFWSTLERYGVERDDLAVGNSGYAKLAQSIGGLLFPDLASDGTYVYWANGEYLIRGKNDQLDNAALAVTPASDAITAFAINATHAYFAGKDGGIFRHSLTPDPDEPLRANALARDQPGVSSLVLSATRVYWATSDCQVRSSPL